MRECSWTNALKRDKKHYIYKKTYTYRDKRKLLERNKQKYFLR